MMWMILWGGCAQDVVCEPGTPVFVDLDDDGFGVDDGDCDDDDPTRFPDAAEVCDGVDNDCNGEVDDGLSTVMWYPDLDGDGFGATDEGFASCMPPGAGHVRIGGDCRDDLVDVNPDALEICNGLDDDCNGATDEDDLDVDLSTAEVAFPDDDADGYGDRARGEYRCGIPDGWVDNDLDCDDTTELASPANAFEWCDLIDNDCDGAVDDLDEDIDFSQLILLPCDADGDGFGDPTLECLTCRSTPGIGVDNALDCDDTDALASTPQSWLPDTDGDGAGAGTPTAFQCLNPNDGSAPENNGIDCAPDDPDVYPGAPVIVGDGIDQDCNGIIE